MSIAEKLAAIAENEQKVYEAGYEDGQQAAYDRFWDTYQQNGNRTDYAHAFGGFGWTNETFTPKHDIRPTYAYMMFRNSGIEGDLVEILDKLGVDLDLSQCSNTQYFYVGSKFTRVGVMDLTNNPTGADGMFQSANLKTIDLIKLTEKQNDGDTMFHNATNLENVAFDGTIGNSFSFKSCSKLSTASVQSIIDHLADLTGKTTQTLTLHNDVKYTTSQKRKAVDEKGWTLVGGTEVSDDYFEG